LNGHTLTFGFLSEVAWPRNPSFASLYPSLLRITLDLDDGVKVNYGKFGDLLAEVKTVTGKSNWKSP